MAEEKTAEETSKDEIRYADFSDMGNPELPDEIEEIPAKDELAIQYMDETVDTETQEEPQEEPQPETNVKGEELKPEQESYWQHKYDKEVRPLKEQNELLKQEFEKIKSQINPPKEEEKLVEPIPPQTDDPNDWVDYLKAKDTYRDKVLSQKFESIESRNQQFEQEREQRLQAEQANQLKAHQLGKLQTAGRLTPEEAVDLLNEFSKPAADEDEYFAQLAEYYKWKKGKSTQPSRPKTTATSKPLATQSGEPQGSRESEEDVFISDMNKFINRNY